METSFKPGGTSEALAVSDVPPNPLILQEKASASIRHFVWQVECFKAARSTPVDLSV